VPATLTIRDETATGTPVHEFPLEFQSERITVRDLIRERVYQEVSEYNFRSRRAGGLFRGLVQPTDAERTLNGFKVPKNRDIDWEAQFAQAIDAFGQNGYFILVNDPQAEALVDGTISRRPRHALHLQDPPRQRQHPDGT
jgi:hypothetical protein